MVVEVVYIRCDSWTIFLLLVCVVTVVGSLFLYASCLVLGAWCWHLDWFFVICAWSVVKGVFIGVYSYIYVCVYHTVERVDVVGFPAVLRLSSLSTVNSGSFFFFKQKNGCRACYVCMWPLPSFLFFPLFPFPRLSSAHPLSLPNRGDLILYTFLYCWYFPGFLFLFVQLLVTYHTQTTVHYPKFRQSRRSYRICV